MYVFFILFLEYCFLFSWYCEHVCCCSLFALQDSSSRSSQWATLEDSWNGPPLNSASSRQSTGRFPPCCLVLDDSASLHEAVSSWPHGLSLTSYLHGCGKGYGNLGVFHFSRVYTLAPAVLHFAVQDSLPLNTTCAPVVPACAMVIYILQMQSTLDFVSKHVLAKTNQHNNKSTVLVQKDIWHDNLHGFFRCPGFRIFCNTVWRRNDLSI